MGVSPALCSRGLVAFLYAAFAGQGSKSAILHLGPWTNVVLDPSQRLLLDGPAQRGPCTARGDPLSGMPVSKQQDAPVEAPRLRFAREQRRATPGVLQAWIRQSTARSRRTLRHGAPQRTLGVADSSQAVGGTRTLRRLAEQPGRAD